MPGYLPCHCLLVARLRALLKTAQAVAATVWAQQMCENVRAVTTPRLPRDEQFHTVQ
jgi:hypothetical protein